MNIENHTPIYYDMSDFSDMRRNVRDDPDTALRQVAEQFEAIFMKMMLKSMRDANMGNPLFDSDQSQMYQEMFDNQLSLSLSKGQSNGLADMLVNQLSAALPKKTAENAIVKSLIISNVDETKQQRFINTVRPHAEKAAKELGTSPDILIAQAALETGWGQAVQRHPDGRSGFNLFNIKANNNWQGPIVSKLTLEYKNGITQRERADFRAYTSMAESFNDYVNYLKLNPRYEQALDVSKDPLAYIEALANAGYATDPDYASKVSRLMTRDVSSQTNSTESAKGDNK